ncbi:Zinc finger, RING-type domain and Zinc finger, RING/FYVE/PHD-type domain-containing protein [Strongyloides ratti]|uniref:Zinc finger, RING-type domain and Zinc finger, RING/FYVE/PHD-type domain-containing protein n=1 Tax=Strongyloides ratti TaxID=34506 RepID=A0A090L130_STRRB|nr:Zinc finger, RING-type domain and Zinc finger, RING/FYVE/PHD-type domain-containing protein [Strongyloides ratti]CEF63396.1 Zinc finger, RING-type domain and Zinc finger, RING/FYVE/PHD-type domain-containing protein [Strongyloides ratti]
MTAFLPNYINLITCKKCNDLFKNPVTQICGHTYCQSCINIFIDKNEDDSLTSICYECGYENRYQKCTPNVNIAIKSLVESYLENEGHLKTNKNESQISCSTCKVPLTTSETFTCKTCNQLENLKYNFYCGNCGWSSHKNHEFIQVEFITNIEREKLMQMLCDAFLNIQNNHIKLSNTQNDIILKQNYLIKLAIDSTKDFKSLIENTLKKDNKLEIFSKIKSVKETNLNIISYAVHNFNEVMRLVNFSINDLENSLIPIKNNCINLNSAQKIITNCQNEIEYEPPYKKK